MEPFAYLEKNANDMATVVETYLVEETVDLIYDGEKLDKWNNLVAELGLTGQNSIRQPEKSPIPFQPMNEQLKNIFETLCPTKVNVEKYSASSIPVEILGLVSLSKNEHYFHEIEVWYDEKKKDPACVGVKYKYRIMDNKSSFHSDSTEFDSKEGCEAYIAENGIDGKPYKMWSETRWLIGRWADVKKSFNELAEMAKERFMFEQKTSILQNIKQQQRELDDLELKAATMFGV